MIDVQRPAAAPSSLARKTSYRGHDVLDALHSTFRGKCYLCETPVKLRCFEVDHRMPQGDPRFAHLKHDWGNLFPTCRVNCCNQRRRRYPDGGLLSPGEDVERRVAQEIEPTLSTCLATTGMTVCVFRPIDATDVPAANTAAELDGIHNSSSDPYAAGLRNAILQHLSSLAAGMWELERLSRDPTVLPADLARQKLWVQGWVSSDAPFTMLVRSYFARLPAVRALFGA